MNDPIQSLLQKSHQSLEAAQLLEQQGFYGFSASRAYYAMFYAAQALLLKQGLTFSKHSAVIASFGKEFANTRKLDSKLHRYLIDAEDYRNQGDYMVGKEVSQIQCQESLQWAKEFISEAEAFLQQQE